MLNVNICAIMAISNDYHGQNNSWYSVPIIRGHPVVQKIMLKVPDPKSFEKEFTLCHFSNQCIIQGENWFVSLVKVMWQC